MFLKFLRSKPKHAIIPDIKVTVAKCSKNRARHARHARHAQHADLKLDILTPCVAVI